MNPDKKIRRLQSLLYTSGAGTILFSLWSAIRAIGVFFETTFPVVENSPISQKTLQIVCGIIIFIFLIVSVSLYVYIGRKAMLTGMGKKTSNKYIVLAALSLVLSIAAHIDNVLTLPSAEWFQWKDIVTFVIDMTFNVILGEVIVFSVLLKRMRN